MRRLLLLVAVSAAVVLVGLAALSWRRETGYRAVESWLPAIEVAAEAQQIDPWLLAGVVYAESRGRPDAVSSVGAMGLCQLMPGTAEELAMRLKIDGPPYTPEDNLLMGATYLGELLRRFDGDVDLVLLGYRMGPTKVARESREQGREVFLEGLQSRKSSPWDYRLQVTEAAEVLRARRERG